MNKVTLMGRLTKEPELKAINNDKHTPVCRFTLAVDRNRRNSDEESKTDFIPIVIYGKTAEFTGKYFNKGARVAVAGSIQTRNWEDDTGFKHYVTEVVAEEAEFADGKKEDQKHGDAYEGESRYYPLEEEG